MRPSVSDPMLEVPALSRDVEGANGMDTVWTIDAERGGTKLEATADSVAGTFVKEPPESSSSLMLETPSPCSPVAGGDSESTCGGGWENSKVGMEVAPKPQICGVAFGLSLIHI